MEGNNDFRFNQRLYEDYLSVFGRKVLHVMKCKWKADQKRKHNAYQQRFSSSMPNRRDLTDETSFRPPMIEKETNVDDGFHNDIPFNSNQNIPNGIPTTAQLVQALDTPNNSTSNGDHNVTNHDLITPGLNSNIVYDLYNSVPDDDLIVPGSPATTGNDDPDNTKQIDWDNMFDTELLSEAATNAELVLKQTGTLDQNNFNIQFRREKAKNDVKTKTKKAKLKKNAKDSNINKLKRKNEQITEAIPKKVCDRQKNSFRKQKYTKAVKNWLDDVDPNNPIENNVISNHDAEPIKTMKQAELVKQKTNKKVIQAQLANKDGIMKFGKPKIDITKKHDADENGDTIKTSDEANVTNKIETVNKEKKNKLKFMAPIKSQIPTKDIEYRVITVSEDNIKDHADTLKCTENKELAMVLVYSNGFSQLNVHHTEDTCEPEGIIISNNDDFFYFKGIDQNNKEFFQMLLQNNKIVCYEGKSLLIYLKSTFGLNIHDIGFIDVKIGGSLLDPDSPPEKFSELQKLLSFTPRFTIATESVLQKAAWYLTLLKECALKLVNIVKEEQLWNVFVEIEMKLLPIMAEMERRGVTVDLQKLKSMEDILLTKMKSTELECYKAAGKTFQINSPMQVRALIYDELKLDTKCNVKIRETISKGAKSTSESMLRSLVSVHSLPKLILEYRHLHKAHATFLTGIAQHVKDGIVRPNWVQMAAATGRIASNNPNLQAIPKAPFSLVLFPEPSENIDTDQPALSFRSVYRARAGHTLLAADFKHVECRVFAHAAADEGLRAALCSGQDLFRALAHKWLNKPEAAVSGEERARTKRVVYASLYGAGRRRLMGLLDVSYDQALSVIASFNRTFPSLKSFGRSVVSRCEQNSGRLVTLCGRARRLKNISSNDFALRSQAERQAISFVVQGSAADLCKKAMVLTSSQLRNHSPPLDGYLLLQIHDELVWEIRDQHLETAAAVIKQAMEGCGYQSGLAAPLPVSISTGTNWGEMTEYPTDAD